MENANVKLETLTGSFCLKNCWDSFPKLPDSKRTAIGQSERLSGSKWNVYRKVRGHRRKTPGSKPRLTTGNNWAKQESLIKLVLPFSTHLLGAPAYFGKRWGEIKGLGSNSISRPTVFFLNKPFLFYTAFWLKWRMQLTQPLCQP